MPIYEFYCSDCHTLFNFFSSRIDTAARPDCPRCGRERLERRPARFALVRPASENAEGHDDGPLDDERMERAMAAMAGDLERAGDSDDPRAMAQLMRRFGDAAGLELGPEMEAMVSRLEAGEDPDSVEADFEHLEGEGDDDFEQFFRLRKSGGLRQTPRPKVDDELYFL